jgi:glutamate 5-kinase
MKKSLKYREVISDARRVVVKIGSRVIIQKTGRPDVRRIRHITKEIASLQRSGLEVVMITSGAVGAGMEALGMTNRPKKLPDQQMAAAVGQTRLMSRYDELFSAAGCKVGQILLTHDDFRHRIRMTNARRTIENLIRSKVIPIINENDVVADYEIRADLALGDNDMLASLVVKLIRADLLVLLTSVDGIRETTKSGRTKRVRYIEKVNKQSFALIKDSKSELSKGGMRSKLKTAQAVSKEGCSVIIANGRTDKVLSNIMKCNDVGTMILAGGL